MQNKIDLNIARTLEDFQTLILAIKFGQLDIMDLNNDGYTILHLATINNQYTTIVYLVQ